MTTTRHRRIRAARRERVRAHETRRPQAVAQSVERIDRFDAALTRLLAWSAFAIAAVIVIALAFA